MQLLKNYLSAVIYSSIWSYTSLERAKIKLSENNIRSQETHNILTKKNKAYFWECKSVILPGKLSILCNTVEKIFLSNI